MWRRGSGPTRVGSASDHRIRRTPTIAAHHHRVLATDPTRSNSEGFDADRVPDFAHLVRQVRTTGRQSNAHRPSRAQPVLAFHSGLGGYRDAVATATSRVPAVGALSTVITGVPVRVPMNVWARWLTLG